MAGMVRNHLVLLWSALALSCSAAERQAAPAGGGEEVELPLAISELPEPVRLAAKELFGSLDDCTAESEAEDGMLVYEVSGKLDGIETEFEFSVDGQVYERESATTLDALPAAVRAALEAEAGEDPRVTEIFAVQTHSYEMQVEIDGRTWELEILPTGAVIARDLESE